MKKLRYNAYIVNNQNEFRKAIKEFWCEKGFEKNGFKELKETMVGFPTSYPSLVVMNKLYRGVIYLSNTCIHLNEIKE